MNIKLIVWDLDDTLWSGSLAEGDDVRLSNTRAEYIRLLNNRGIMSAICSKNDPDAARRKLIALGLWDEFLFPRISFTPKAPSIKQLIIDMQLRAENVLFIDNDAHNLREVKFLMPEIRVVDAATESCDQLLDLLLIQSKEIGRNRMQDYRILEAKHRDRTISNLAQEEFLRSCNIHLTLVYRMDNLDFAPRIEGLINRSNQLNYTKSRVEPDAILELIADISNHQCFGILAWDDYGYHGLIGFAVVNRDKKITHFVFSCRIMHMGIENWTLDKLRQLFPRLDVSDIPLIPKAFDWITEVSFHESAIRAKVYESEFPVAVEPPTIRVMANCQSGAIAHFSGLASTALFDNAPQGFSPRKNIDRVFCLKLFMSEEYLSQEYPQMLVYGAFVDYVDNYWPDIIKSDLETTIYRKCVQRFCNFVQSSGRTALVIIPFEQVPDHKIPEHFGVSKKRLAHFNRIWRNAAKIYSDIEILDLNMG